MLDKVSGQNKLSVFDFIDSDKSKKQASQPQENPLDGIFYQERRDPDISDPTPSMKSAWRKNRDEEKKAERQGRESFEDIQRDLANQGVLGHLRGGSHIRPATAEFVTNEGGSGNMMGCQSQNSMFDPNRIDKMADKLSSREKTIAEKQAIAERREEMNSEDRSDKFPDQNDVVPSPSSIATAFSDSRSSAFGITAGHMSISDESEFERLQPTAGEGIERRAAKKDDSWREAENQKALSSRDVQNRLLDGLVGEFDAPANNNRHQAAVDKLFDMLNSNEEN